MSVEKAILKLIKCMRVSYILYDPLDTVPVYSFFKYYPVTSRFINVHVYRYLRQNKYVIIIQAGEIIYSTIKLEIYEKGYSILEIKISNGGNTIYLYTKRQDQQRTMKLVESYTKYLCRIK